MTTAWPDLSEIQAPIMERTSGEWENFSTAKMIGNWVLSVETITDIGIRLISSFVWLPALVVAVGTGIFPGLPANWIHNKWFVEHLPTPPPQPTPPAPIQPQPQPQVSHDIIPAPDQTETFLRQRRGTQPTTIIPRNPAPFVAPTPKKSNTLKMAAIGLAGVAVWYFNPLGLKDTILSNLNSKYGKEISSKIIKYIQGIII